MAILKCSPRHAVARSKLSRDLAALLLLSVSGCAWMRDPEYSMIGGGSDRVNSAGVHQMLDPPFEKIDIVGLLDPDNATHDDYKKCDALNSDSRQSCRVDTAFRIFDEDSGRNTPQRRNNIQDRLLAASDQRCNVYLTYIQRHYSASNFLFGSLTTVLGGAGALVTGAGAARALAGSAGVVSGVRAEYDQSYFYNQTINVISQGIRQRRKDILGEINSENTGRGTSGSRDTTAYTVEAAVRDAIRYHGACSVVAGLEQVSITVNLSAGLDSLEASTKKVRSINSELQSNSSGSGGN